MVSSTTIPNERFVQVAVFLAQVAHLYQEDMAFLAGHLRELLEAYGPVLNPYTRRKVVSCLMIMRAKNLLLPVETARFMLELLSIPDKSLRRLISSSLVNDVKRINKHRRNNLINKRLQETVQELLARQEDGGARKVLRLAIDLYFKGYWRDAFTVNMIAAACFNEAYKLRLAAGYFLLSTTKPPEPDSDEEEEDPFQLRDKKGKTRLTKAKLESLAKRRKRLLKKQERKLQAQGEGLRVLPIDQIYNPQKFIERMFTRLHGKEERFSVKLVFMGVLSRMMRRHRLTLPAYFSYLNKYIQPSQKELLKVLLALAEAVHPLVESDSLAGTMKVLT